jgi:hypothetical protein
MMVMMTAMMTLTTTVMMIMCNRVMDNEHKINKQCTVCIVSPVLCSSV